MAENASATTPSTLPSAPQPAAAAQNQQYDAAQGNGQANPSHMPPPPRPPVIIPQNNNPIPTAMGSPMSGNMMSPTSAGGYVRRAAPEPNKRALYVGGLDPRVTEDILKQIFETTGHVVSVKIIPDKNVSTQGDGRPTATPMRDQQGISMNMQDVGFLHRIARSPSTLELG
jgi:nucleolysin TIA-1/TIAR